MPSLEELLMRTFLGDIAPRYSHARIEDVPVCGEEDAVANRHRLLLPPQDDHAVYFPLAEQVSPRTNFRNISTDNWRRILTATNGFRYDRSERLANGIINPLGPAVAHLCRSQSSSLGRYEMFVTKNAIIDNRSENPTALRRIPMSLTFQEIVTLVRGLSTPDGASYQIPNSHYQIDPLDHTKLSLAPDRTEIEDIIAMVQDPNSPFLPRRRQEISSALRRVIRFESEMSSSMSIQTYLAMIFGLPALIGAYAAFRQFGWTKPIDPHVDRLIIGAWNLLGLRPKVSFMRQISAREATTTVSRAVGRDGDYLRLRERMGTNRGRVTTVVARAGEGKTHFALGLTREIYEGRIPEFNPALTDFFALDLNELMGSEDTKYIGQLQVRFLDFARQIEAGARKGRLQIVFIDEIHRIAGMGATEGGDSGIGDMAKAKLSEWENNSNIRLMAATTVAEYPQLVKNPKTGEPDEAIRRRYPAIRLTRLSRPLLTDLLNSVAEKWQARGVTISAAVRERIMDLSCHPDVGIANPDAALSILDLAETRVRIRQLKDLTVEIVDEVFAEDISIKPHAHHASEIHRWRFNQEEYDRRMNTEEASSPSSSASSHLTTPIDHALNEAAFGRVHPELERFYREQFSSRPMSTFSQLIDRVRELNPALADRAREAFGRPGVTVEGLTFDLVFGLAAHSGRAVGEADPRRSAVPRETFERHVATARTSREESRPGATSENREREMREERLRTSTERGGRGGII